MANSGPGRGRRWRGHKKNVGLIFNSGLCSGCSLVNHHLWAVALLSPEFWGSPGEHVHPPFTVYRGQTAFRLSGTQGTPSLLSCPSLLCQQHCKSPKITLFLQFNAPFWLLCACFSTAGLPCDDTINILRLACFLSHLTQMKTGSSYLTQRLWAQLSK